MKLKTILFLIIIFLVGWIWFTNEHKGNSYTEGNIIQWHHVTYGSQNNRVDYTNPNYRSNIGHITNSLQPYNSALIPYLYFVSHNAKIILIKAYYFVKEELPVIINYLTTPTVENNDNNVAANYNEPSANAYEEHLNTNNNYGIQETSDNTEPGIILTHYSRSTHVYKTDKRFIHTVCIDPGHGGKDPGAIGINGLEEKNITLSIALKLAHFLRAHQYRVAMTRTGDYFVSLPQRVRMVNNSNCDILISIHINASRNIQYNGITTYVNRYFNLNTIQGHNSFILAHLIQGTLVDNLNQQSLGVQGADFYVLRHVHIPAVLVEVLFITNPNDVRELRSYSFREDIAWNLFKAIYEIRPDPTQLAER